MTKASWSLSAIPVGATTDELICAQEANKVSTSSRTKNLSAMIDTLQT